MRTPWWRRFLDAFGAASQRKRQPWTRQRLQIEVLEARLAPAATITSTPTSILIAFSAADTATVSVSAGAYQITDAAGIDAGSTGGVLSGGNTIFTANNAAAGQTAFTIGAGSAGTVQLLAANTIPTTTTVTINAGFLDLNGNSDAIDALTGSATVTNTGATAMLTIGSNGGGGTFSGVITNSANALNLLKTGAGTETLSGNSTYTGTTEVNEGTLTDAIANALPTTTDLTVDGTGIFNLDGNAQAVGGLSNGNSVTGEVTDSGVAATFTDAGNWAFAGSTFNNNGGTVIFDGSGPQTLDNGTASFNNLSHTGAGSLQLVNNGLTVGGTLTNAATAGDFDANGQAVTVTGATTLSGGTYLASTGTQSFNGGLTINGGDFTGSSGIVNTAALSLSSGTLTAPGATGAFNVAGNWSKTGGTFAANAGAVTFDGSSAQSITSGGGSFNNVTIDNSGAAAVQLADTFSAGAALTVSGGTLNLNGQSATATGNVVVTSPGTLEGAGAITGNVSGTGAIVPGVSPALGILTINGSFTPGGAVDFIVNSPYTTAGADYDQIIVSGTVGLSGATLDITGGTAAASPQRVVTLIKNNGGSATTINGSTSPAQGGAVTLGSEVFNIFYNGGAGHDVVLVDASTPTVAYVSGTFASDNPGQVIADADFGTTGNQPAVFDVNAFATIDAALSAVTSSGQVIVNTGTYAEAVSVAGARTMTITTGAAVTVNSLASVAGTTVQILAASSSLTVGDATSTTVSGTVSGAGTLTKQGAGELTLAGTNSYTGATTVSAGTLQVTSSLSASTTTQVTLTGAATLDGNSTGQILRPVIVAASGAEITNLTVKTSSTTVDGITVQTGADNVTISGDTVTGNQNGINVAAVTGLQLTNSHFDSNARGMLMTAGVGGTVAATGTTFSNNTIASDGAGIDVASGALTLTNVTVAGNVASAAGNQGAGILITAGASVSVPSSGGTVSVSNNSASGLRSQGGGIFVAGTLTQASGSTLSIGTNKAAAGGGLFISSGGTVTLGAADIQSNQASAGNGGGIDIVAGAGAVSITASTVASNSATGAGAGIDAETGFASTLKLTNSTISTNTGDGIDVAAGTLTLDFDTIAYNTLGGLKNTAAAANVQAQDSLFADNPSFDYQGPLSTSLGNNLIQTRPAVATTLIASDLTNVPALLAPLGNNTGPTPTDALLPGSTALAAGIAIAGVTTDQRGISRPAKPDIGAFQSQGFTVSTVTPSAVTYRTLIGNPFLQSDGLTAQGFQAQVTSAAGESVVGGRILFTTTTVSGATGAANPNYVIQSVSTTNKTITFALANSSLAATTPLIYDDGGGTNLPIGGLTEGGTYFAKMVTATTFQLTNTPGGSVIALTAGTGANQTLVPAIIAGGTAQTIVLANGTASPATGVSPDYNLTASAGGLNVSAAWNLFNQKAASLSYAVGGVATGFQPQNAQSGVGADSPSGLGIQFKAGAAAASPTFTVTLMDQETPAQPIVISNQTVTLQVVYKTSIAGTINSIGTSGGVTLTAPAPGNTASAMTTQGMATYTDLQLYESIFNSATSKGYQLLASFKNPGSTVATTTASAAFSILPYELVVAASNFSGFEQMAFNITVASSDRGLIRFVSITEGLGGLLTNQVKIQALDYTGTGVPMLSTTYNGPITLSATDNNGNVVLENNLSPYTMTGGSVLVSNITPLTALGAFNLFADTSTAAADPDGVINVSSKNNGQAASFIRVNLGRQR